MRLDPPGTFSEPPNWQSKWIERILSKQTFDQTTTTTQKERKKERKKEKTLTAASRCAPLSSLGSASMLTTESRIFSTD
jgi:hypothetical protein